MGLLLDYWPLVLGGVVLTALVVLGAVQQRREVRRARGSRWATWMDEPRDYFGEDGE